MTVETRTILAAALQLTASQIKLIVRLGDIPGNCGATIGHLSRNLHISQDYLGKSATTLAVYGILAQGFRGDGYGDRQPIWYLTENAEQALAQLAAACEITDIASIDPSIPQAA